MSLLLYQICVLFCREFYVTSVSWVQGNHQISVVYMTRAQNLSIISSCFSPNWTCIEVSFKNRKTGKTNLPTKKIKLKQTHPHTHQNHVFIFFYHQKIKSISFNDFNLPVYKKKKYSVMPNTYHPLM